MRTIATGALSVLAPALLGGCFSQPMTLDSKLDGRMEGNFDGRMEGTFKVDGPLMLQLQGPTITYEGTYVSDELVDRVKVDKTTDEWVLAVFGEPDVRKPMRDGSEIWRWTYRPTEQTTSLLSLFNTKDQEPRLSIRTVFVQVRGGVVVDKWSG